MAPLEAARRARVLPTGPYGRNTEFRALYDRPMRMVLVLAGAAMVLGGLVWLAQGLNLPFAPRSFMIADRSWAFIGAVVAVAGVVVIGWARRGR